MPCKLPLSLVDMSDPAYRRCISRELVVPHETNAKCHFAVLSGESGEVNALRVGRPWLAAQLLTAAF